MKTNKIQRTIHSLITIFFLLFGTLTFILSNELGSEILSYFGAGVYLIALITMPDHWRTKLEAFGKEAGRVTQQH